MSETASTTTSKAVMSQRQITLVIVGLMAGMFLSALDQTVVGTAIRTIGDDLHGLDEQAWVTTAYLILSTIATPIYGKLSDLFGRRPLFIFSISVFVVGSVLASFSQSMIMLAVFRGLQGLGAGGLMSLPLAIMGDILAPRERAKYQGYFMALFGISSVVGPLVGGLFAGASQILWISGWRWVFLLNVPIGIIALIIVIAFLHIPHQDKAKPRIDWWGATAVIVALVPGLLVAEEGQTWGWTDFKSIICYVICVIGFIAFPFIERAMGEDALIPLKLFSSKTFSMATIIGVFVGFAMFGAMMTIPLYLQIVIGMTPTESGLGMLPMILGLMISSITSGQIMSRTGKYQFFPLIGTAFLCGGFLEMTFLTADKPMWFMMLGMFMIGLGLGQLMQTLTTASQNSVDVHDMGVATSASTFFRQLGGTVGTAILISVLFTLMPTNISTAMQNKTDMTAALDAALNPAIVNASNNLGTSNSPGITPTVYASIVTPLKKAIQEGSPAKPATSCLAAQPASTGLDGATTQVTEGVKAGAEKEATATVTAQVTAEVKKAVAAGQIPAAQESVTIKKEVAAALPAALKKAQAEIPAATATQLQAAATKAHASVVDGKLEVDWSNASQRSYWVNQLAPKLITQMKCGSTSSAVSGSTQDTSFLTGATKALAQPFRVGFSNSATVIYWVALFVALVAFILTWFFRAPALRQKSALQEAADRAAAAATDGGAGADPGAGADAAPGGSAAGTPGADTSTDKKAGTNAGKRTGRKAK